MSVSGRRAQLFRMEEAGRQTQRQLEMIDRQIMRRMRRLFRNAPAYRTPTPNPADARTFLERYRSNLAAITQERQHEIDALSRKLARQDAAIAALRDRIPQDLLRA
ncbi:hypothetical protein [Mesorhizobium sp. L2C066B000]|uniref:hypothetical protein n=1 Tax=Mesorhizobium sp. L2C066B000 TaxID=1287105 RepID=UPI0003D01D2A|nr:hypothetical protein [Mesorhizobium sp. L2C066B000]ESZ32887.1 hypothetical protein X732_27635 [Mesorhizobium sp. L2C066B000]